MLMIAGHLDSKVPLTRILCVTLDQLPAAVLPASTLSLGNGQMQHRGVVMDIEAIKWCHPEQPSEPEKGQELVEKKSCEQRKRQPMIFVRYALTDSDREAIDNSAQELSDEGISQRRTSCSLEEIQYVLSLLQEQENCVDEAYRTQWKEKSAFNGTVFRLSLLRPTLEPLFPHRTAKLKQQAHKERMMKRQAEEQMRMDELQMRRDKGEIVDKVCCKLGCEEWALLQCSRCPNVCYCCEKRKLMIAVVLLSLFPFPPFPCVIGLMNGALLHVVLSLHHFADQRQDWMERHGEVCRSEQYIKCALPACPVRVLVGYTDPNRPFQVNEETTLRRKLMDAASGSAAPELRYFCSQTHCEEGKEEGEATMKEYNGELARKERELRRIDEEKISGFEEKQMSINMELDLLNAELGRNVEGTATATLSAADPGPVKTITEQPVHLKATSSLEGVKEGRSGEIDVAIELAQKESELNRNEDDDTSPHDGSALKSADGTDDDAATAAGSTTATTTTTTTTGAPEVVLKHGDVSPDPNHSNNTTAVSCCSHPSCSLPGTKSCGLCKMTPYCSAKCQTADWPRHKEECQGQLRKMGKAHLAKSLGFRQQNWEQTLRYAELAATKLKQLKDRRLETVQAIDEALSIKFTVLYLMARYREAQESAEERYTLWAMNHMRNPEIIKAALELVQSCFCIREHEDAERYARHAYFLVNDTTDNFIPVDDRPRYLADVSSSLASAILNLAKAGGIPPEEKQKAGEEAITLARKTLEIHTQLNGTESTGVACDMRLLADVLDQFNGVDDDEIPRLREQAIAIYGRVEGSSSYNVAVGENNLGATYKNRAKRARAVNDLDRCVANLELALSHYRKAARIFRANNVSDKADMALLNVVNIEEFMRQVGIA